MNRMIALLVATAVFTPFAIMTLAQAAQIIA